MITGRFHALISSTLFLSLYPVIALLYVYGGGSSWQAICTTGSFLLINGLARLHFLLMRKQRRSHPVWFRMQRLLAGIGCGALLFWTSPLQSMFLTIVLATLAVLSYQIAIRLCTYDWDVLIHPYLYTAICTWTALSCLFIWIGGKTYSYTGQIVILLLASGVFAIAHNAAGMERALQGAQSGVQQDATPVFRYNVRILLVAFGLLTTIVLLYKWIGVGIERCLKWLLTGVSKLVSRIASLFPHNHSNLSGNSVSEDTGAVQAFAQQEHPIWSIIFLSAAAFILLIIILYNRTWILTGIQSAWKTLLYHVRQWLHTSIEERQNAGSGAYVDYTENLLETEEKFRKQIRKPSAVRWKKRYRVYRNMPYSVQRYRMGYGLAVEQLVRSGIIIASSDSVEQILKKVQDRKPEESALWEAITMEYNRVRYGLESVEESDFIALEQILEKKGRNLR